jgi:hypothetical protein
VLKKGKEISLSGLACFAMFFVAILPLFWFLGVLTFAVRASRTLGYWPVPYHPDPKALSFDLHYVVIFLGGYLVVASLAILPTLRLCSIGLVEQAKWLKAKHLYFIGWGLLLAFFLVPKVNFVAWFLD